MNSASMSAKAPLLRYGSMSPPPFVTHSACRAAVTTVFLVGGKCGAAEIGFELTGDGATCGESGAVSAGRSAVCI